MIVADTHTAFWMTAEPGRLSEIAASALSAARRDGEIIAVSDKTLWELAMMIEKKKIEAPLPLGQYLRVVERFFKVLPVNADIAEKSMAFTRNYPRDPADRIIGATAISYGVPLVTGDQAIRESNEVHCIW